MLTYFRHSSLLMTYLNVVILNCLPKTNYLFHLFFSFLDQLNYFHYVDHFHLLIIIKILHFLGRKKREIQSKIDLFQFPSAVNRISFNLQKFANWKSAEYRVFFKYMSLHVFKKYLSSPYFYSLTCLVYGKLKLKSIKYFKFYLFMFN